MRDVAFRGYGVALSRISSIAFGFFIIAFMTPRYGVDELALVLAGMAGIQAMTYLDFGTGALLISRLPHLLSQGRLDEATRTWRTYSAVVTRTAMVPGIVGLAGLLYVASSHLSDGPPGGPEWSFWLAMCGASAFFYSTRNERLAWACSRPQSAGLADASGPVIAALATIAIVAEGGEPWLIVAALAWSRATTFMLLGLWLGARPGRAREILRQSCQSTGPETAITGKRATPVFILGLAELVALQLDPAFLLLFASAEVAAEYGLVQRLALPAVAIGTIIMQPAWPQLASLRRAESAGLFQRVRRRTAIVLAASTATYLIAQIIFGPQIGQLIAGELIPINRTALVAAALFVAARMAMAWYMTLVAALDGTPLIGPTMTGFYAILFGVKMTLAATMGLAAMFVGSAIVMIVIGIPFLKKHVQVLASVGHE